MISAIVAYLSHVSKSLLPHTKTLGGCRLTNAHLANAQVSQSESREALVKHAFSSSAVSHASDSRICITSLIFKTAQKINQLAWSCQHGNKDKQLAVATEGCSGNTILRVSVLLFDILQQHKKQLHWSIFHQVLQAEHLLRLLCKLLRCWLWFP